MAMRTSYRHHSARALTTAAKRRPLERTASINSGSTLGAVAPAPAIPPSSSNDLSQSLVGGNVHGSFNSLRDRNAWMRKPLFARPGADAGFSSGKDAAERLEREAVRRDPYQTDFIESLRDVTKSIAPLIDRTPYLAWVLKQLMEPERIVTFRVSWKDDSANWRMNRGYRIQYSSALGPFRGPLRFDAKLTHGSMRATAFESVFAHALCGDKIGGACGGADLDVADKSPEELRRFCLAFAKALGTSGIAGMEVDVLDGGPGVGEHELASVSAGLPAQSSFSVGVDVERSLGRYAAFIADACAPIAFPASRLENKRCILSGCGPRTLSLAKALCSLGARVVSFSDASGFISDADGFDLDAVVSLEKLLKNRGHLEDFRHISKSCSFHPAASGASLWESVKGDAAFPSSITSELSSDDAQALVGSGCKAVFEVYDRACSETATQVLQQEKILFAPSKLVLSCPPSLALESATAEEDALLKARTRKFIEYDIADAAKEGGFEPTNLQAGASILAFSRLAATDMFKSQ